MVNKYPGSKIIYTFNKSMGPNFPQKRRTPLPLPREEGEEESKSVALHSTALPSQPALSVICRIIQGCFSCLHVPNWYHCRIRVW